LFAAISFIKGIVSDESLGFLACAFDLRLQNTPKSSRGPREIRRLPGQGRAPVSRFGPSWRSAHQEKPISFLVDRSFDLSTKDDQLVSSQGVLYKPVGFSSGHLDECSEQK
jgi:hypothetical protein